MKYEFGAEKPEQFRQYWPGQYDFFSYMEYACAIPQPLFAITTRKADGKPNINFHSWSCFQGDKGGFFRMMRKPHSCRVSAGNCENPPCAGFRCILY